MTVLRSGAVQAAGGVVWRPRPGGGDVELLLVHRPRYDDWTLPKGKLAALETHEQAARREVAEETGLRCTLGPELPPTSYLDRQRRPKIVRYWAMTSTGGWFSPNDEVDAVRWVTPAGARDLLSYPRDIAVVDALVAAVAG